MSIDTLKQIEDPHCISCGSHAVDTGWECTDCGCDMGPILSMLASQSTPAGEVTADAVEVRRVDVVSTGSGCRVMPFPEGNYVHYSDYAALVQQVERLKAELRDTYTEIGRLREEVEQTEAKRDTLSAENARLAKDAERLDYLESLSADGVHVELCHQGSFSAGTLKVAATVFVGRPQAEFTGATIREAIDAATAQAKQAEGDNNAR